MVFRSSVAVVGTGFIGPIHVEGLQRAGLRVTGILGSTPAKSQAAADQLGLPRAYRDLAEILTDKAVDAVHLTTPNHLHFDQVKAVLAVEKHVICEKPLAMDSTQSAELVRLAGESGRAAAVAYNIRFYPLCQEAFIRAQSIGELLHVTGSYVQDWLLFDTDYNWRVEAHAGGRLRAIADIGTHWIDLIQFITGCRVIEVCADLRTIHSTRQRPLGGAETFAEATASGKQVEPVAIDTEDCGSVMLRFDNSAIGCLWVSQTTAGRKNCLRIEISGARQSLAWNSELPNELWIGHRDQPNQSLIRDPQLLDPRAARYSNYPGGHNEGFPDTFKQLFRSFYGYVEAGDFSATPPFPTFEDGHREILICEAVLRSHQQGGWVRVAESSR